MVVIDDTSPVNYLVLIAAIDILPKLYGGVAIPQPVLEELRHPDVLQPVVEWANDFPEWVEVVAAAQLNVDADLTQFGRWRGCGNRAGSGPPDALLLMDDAKGRDEAGRRHIPTIGTLGILRDAASLGFVDLSTAFARLAQTTFRAPLPLMNALLEQDAARAKKTTDDIGDEY